MGVLIQGDVKSMNVNLNEIAIIMLLTVAIILSIRKR